MCESAGAAISITHPVIIMEHTEQCGIVNFLKMLLAVKL
uniref:Uncharacterized protein n=1 Tax=Anguilla anguilla TaxID=7936 RepID=A0A0E9SNJ5_ANGAN